MTKTGMVDFMREPTFHKLKGMYLGGRITIDELSRMNVTLTSPDYLSQEDIIFMDTYPELLPYYVGLALDRLPRDQKMSQDLLLWVFYHSVGIYTRRYLEGEIWHVAYTVYLNRDIQLLSTFKSSVRDGDISLPPNLLRGEMWGDIKLNAQDSYLVNWEKFTLGIHSYVGVISKKYDGVSIQLDKELGELQGLNGIDPLLNGLEKERTGSLVLGRIAVKEGEKEYPRRYKYGYNR